MPPPRRKKAEKKLKKREEKATTPVVPPCQERWKAGNQGSVSFGDVSGETP
jgi:hypothetical protein